MPSTGVSVMSGSATNAVEKSGSEMDYTTTSSDTGSDTGGGSSSRRRRPSTRKRAKIHDMFLDQRERVRLSNRLAAKRHRDRSREQRDHETAKAEAMEERRKQLRFQLTALEGEANTLRNLVITLRRPPACSSGAWQAATAAQATIPPAYPSMGNNRDAHGDMYSLRGMDVRLMGAMSAMGRMGAMGGMGSIGTLGHMGMTMGSDGTRMSGADSFEHQASTRPGGVNVSHLPAGYGGLNTAFGGDMSNAAMGALLAAVNANGNLMSFGQLGAPIGMQYATQHSAAATPSRSTPMLNYADLYSAAAATAVAAAVSGEAQGWLMSQQQHEPDVGWQ